MKKLLIVLLAALAMCSGCNFLIKAKDFEASGSRCQLPDDSKSPESGV